MIIFESVGSPTDLCINWQVSSAHTVRKKITLGCVGDRIQILVRINITFATKRGAKGIKEVVKKNKFSCAVQVSLGLEGVN